MIAVESLELHLGIPCDRVRVTTGKPLKADLYLPGRDLYVELDREGHDLAPARETTFGYYPPGLPRGFEPDRHRRLIAALGTQPTSKMYNGRALVDFLKDLYVEGILGKPLVRLAKSDLSFLLGAHPGPCPARYLPGGAGREAEPATAKALARGGSSHHERAVPEWFPVGSGHGCLSDRRGC